MRDWDVQTYDYWCERLDQEKTDRSLPRAGIKVGITSTSSQALESQNSGIRGPGR